MRKLLYLLIAAALCVPVGAQAWWKSIQQAAVSGGAAFTPASLPNLLAWYKADAGTFSDAGVTPATNGGTIQQWNDLSGNGHNVSQATSGSRPTFVTGALNSLPVVNNPSSMFMDTGASVPLGGTTVSVFIVVQATATNSGRAICFFDSNDVNTDAWLAPYFSSLTTPTDFNGGNQSSGTVTSGSWNEIGSIWDGTNNTMYINGTAQTSAGSTNTFATTGTIKIFTDVNNNNSLGGNIAEIVVTSGALSSTDRTNLHNYFAAKWGV